MEQYEFFIGAGLIFFALLLYRRNVVRRVRKRKRNGKRKIIMSEILNSCIGKMCTIYVYGEFGISARIVSVSDGWVQIERKNGMCDLINIEYISRINVKDKD